jgi:uncharacterized membrane protein YwzB
MNTLIAIICIIAAVAVLCWFIQSVTLPPMVKTVIYAVLALLMIAAVFDYATGAHHVGSLLH